MFPDMRRAKQKLTFKECVHILNNAQYGVLGTGGVNDWPYAVPLSYTYERAKDVPEGEDLGRIYLHCAPEGHKLDAIAVNPRVTFAVVGKNDVFPQKLTTLFQSVICFGIARIAEPEEKRHALYALGKKYCPGLDDMVVEETDKLFGRTCIIAIDVEHLTGKEAIELVQARDNLRKHAMA